MELTTQHRSSFIHSHRLVVFCVCSFLVIIMLHPSTPTDHAATQPDNNGQLNPGFDNTFNQFSLPKTSTAPSGSARTCSRRQRDNGGLAFVGKFFLVTCCALNHERQRRHNFEAQVCPKSISTARNDFHYCYYCYYYH